MDDDSDIVYRVVVNHEEQYSIWPADRDLPAGWRDEGTTGPKDQCLHHIDEVWVDMRPLSLRRYMEQAPPADDSILDEPDDPADSLVSRLSRGDHPVRVSIRPEPSGPALRDAVERGYVFVRFTGTRGGTELGITIDRDAIDLTDADFEAQRGRIVLVGDLTLDFEPIRCTAEIDLETFTGRARVAVRESSP
jgi:uncharacterized protein YbdZ (MbtH family)